MHATQSDVDFSLGHKAAKVGSVRSLQPGKGLVCGALHIVSCNLDALTTNTRLQAQDASCDSSPKSFLNALLLS